MTPAQRTTRRTGYPALMLVGIVYIATLAIVVSPESFRPIGSPPEDGPPHPDPKGTP